MDPTIEGQQAWMQQLGYTQQNFLPMVMQDMLARIHGIRQPMAGNSGNPGLNPMNPMNLPTAGSSGTMPMLPQGSAIPGMAADPTQRPGLGRRLDEQGMLQNLSALRNRYPNTTPSPP